MTRRASCTRQQRGMTLVELLVAIVIGMVVTLAATSAITFGESQKRSTTAVNDMGQSGAYAAYVLDRAIRSAGSGFTQSWDLGVFGCRLNAARAGTAILPRATAFVAPFQNFLGGAGGAATLRVAPLLIASGQGSDGASDVVAVMGGNAAAGDVPRAIRSSGATANLLRLDNTIGLKQSDIVLVSQAGTDDCYVEQVSGSPTFADSVGNEVLPLGSTYYTPAGGTLQALAAGGNAYLTPLGNAAAGDVQFQLFGVGTNRTLFSYDLLRGSGNDEVQALVDGVVRMNALYGMVDPATGAFTGWVAPTGTHAIANMMATPQLARSVAAVRIALVLRSNHFEREGDDGQKVAPAAITLFGDLDPALQRTLVLSDDEQHYRHRVVDFTVPLRNVLLLPTS